MRQWAGVCIAPFMLKSAIDTFWVAGDRQAQFARKLGYHRILWGFYAADVERFKCTQPLSARSASFLFVGRLIPEKNIQALAEAYAAYRERVESPWDLRVVGTGPLTSLLHGRPGVLMTGFLSPNQVASIMASSRCLVLPSVIEPWGVVIHEAAAAGLAVIASYECGAVTYFLRDRINGFVVGTDADSIRDAMIKITSSSNERLDAMFRSSLTLASLWTPSLQASYFCDGVSERLARSARNTPV